MVTNALKQLLTETEWGQLDYLIIDTLPNRRCADYPPTDFLYFGRNSCYHTTTNGTCRCTKAIGMLNDKHIGVPILGIVENMSWFTPTKHPDEKYLIFDKVALKTIRSFQSSCFDTNSYQRINMS